jgi:hypothetical protein
MTDKEIIANYQGALQAIMLHESTTDAQLHYLMVVLAKDPTCEMPEEMRKEALEFEKAVNAHYKEGLN